jgi:hypothetical protein
MAGTGQKPFLTHLDGFLHTLNTHSCISVSTTVFPMQPIHSTHLDGLTVRMTPTISFNEKAGSAKCLTTEAYQQQKNQQHELTGKGMIEIYSQYIDQCLDPTCAATHMQSKPS